MLDGVRILITGATGYMGTRLAIRLLAREHSVTAFVRPGSAPRVPVGCRIIEGDVFDPVRYADALESIDVLVHLVGVAHPAPWKADRFLSVDLASAQVAAQAVRASSVRRVVYVSVAQPAPMMHAYLSARSQAEAAFRESGIPLTCLRPWYVLGPGHWWPMVLLPMYRLLECFPVTRDSARRLGLVTIDQMLNALVDSVENPAHGNCILDVPAIRAISL